MGKLSKDQKLVALDQMLDVLTTRLDDVGSKGLNRRQFDRLCSVAEELMDLSCVWLPAVGEHHWYRQPDDPGCDN